MSVDEVGAVSAEMCREFFRPELICMAETFGGLGIHCCADARHQWDNFRGIPKLRLINHGVPPTRNPREYILASLRHYGGTVAQMPKGWTPDGAAETWPAQFPEGTRVVFEIQSETAAQAIGTAERLQRIRQTGADAPGI